MDETASGQFSANPAAICRPGGISWQAVAVNLFTRHVLKRRIERRGIDPGSARFVVGWLELLTAGFADSVAAGRKIIGGVPCDVIAPSQPTAVERVVLYLHGGGFFVHLPRSYRNFARRIADAYGATVYLPDYRLAPEHRHPAASDDCMAVYRALLKKGCNPKRMAVMGDSAGGNLALVTLLRARDEGLPQPACATLLSPGLDLTLSGNSFVNNSQADPMLPVSALRQVARQYVDAGSKAHPYASPMLGDFTGLPPLRIIVGSTEVLLDSSVTTARSFRAAGGEVALQVWHEMPHVFPLIRFLPEGQLALAQMAGFFNQQLAQDHEA